MLASSGMSGDALKSKIEEWADSHEVSKRTNKIRPLTQVKRDSYFQARYLAHRYWGRRPWYMVRQHILHYTRDEKDIILDSFCGSGITVIESLILKRKVIGVDLNPMAIFITDVTAKFVDLEEVKRAFTEVEKKVASRINSLYHKDEQEISIDYWYPKKELPKSSFGVSKEGVFVSDLFSKRNLAAAAMLFDAINTVEIEDNVRNVLKFAFTASLAQFTKMIRTKKTGTGWYLTAYRIPREYRENNVWNRFRNKFLATLRTKKETNELIGKNQDYILKNCSATDLSVIPDEKIDYAFIDPPWAIKYFDLNVLWCSWIGFPLDFEKEIFPQSNAFDSNMIAALDEIYRVLRPGHFATMNFANRNATVLNVMKSIMEKSKFQWVETVRNEQSQLSYVQQESKMALKGDYLLTLSKSPKQTELLKYTEENGKISEGSLRQMITAAIIKEGGKASYDGIMSRIYPELIKNGLEEDIHKVLNRYFKRTEEEDTVWTLA